MIQYLLAGLALGASAAALFDALGSPSVPAEAMGKVLRGLGRSSPARLPVVRQPAPSNPIVYAWNPKGSKR